MINNSEIPSINQESYDDFVQEASLIMESKSDQHWTLNEMMSIKIYCESSDVLQEAINNKPDDFYWLVLNLYRASLYHAKPIPKQANALFFEIDDVYILNKELPFHNIPAILKTTRPSLTANSAQKGLLWTIRPSYSNFLHITVGIDIAWISRFENESSYLLINQYLPIINTINHTNASDNKIQQLLQQLKPWENPITKPDVFCARYLGFLPLDSWLDGVTTNPLLSETCSFQDSRVITRLVEELKFGKHNGFEELYQNVLNDSFVDNLVFDKGDQVIHLEDSSFDPSQKHYLLRQEYAMIKGDVQCINKPSQQCLYRFYDIDNFVFPIPFLDTNTTWSVYVRMSNNKYICIKTFNIAPGMTSYNAAQPKTFF